MITRYNTIPAEYTSHGITRRRALKYLTGAATGAAYLEQAKRVMADPGDPFTVILIPDPQGLAGNAPSGELTCSGPTAYNATLNWMVTNKNLTIGGVPLNIKGAISVGDCVNQTTAASMDTQQTRAVNAVNQILTASPKMFFTPCAGNHDYENYTTINRNQVGYMFRDDAGKTGAWSPSTLSTVYGSGMDLGSGDVAYWGGAFTNGAFPVSSANSWMRLFISGMKFGVISVEFFATATVLNQAKALMASYPDHQWWITTHSYLDMTGARCSSASSLGPQHYGFTVANANSGIQMWSGGASEGGGDATWPGFSAVPNLTGIFCGHWIDGYSGGANWVYQRLTTTSSSSAAQSVQQIFCNCQEHESLNYCSGNPLTPNGTTDAMHLLLMHYFPATQTMKHYLISVNSGKYIGPNSSYNSDGAVNGIGATVPVDLTGGGISLISPNISLFPMPQGLSGH